MDEPVETFSHIDELDGNHIRLLQLRWGPRNSIYGKVRTVALESKKSPIFMAVSYFCGDKMHDKPVYLKIEGEQRERRPFAVYDNLYPLLELLCDHQGFEPELWWWIDSICITSQSQWNREKELQVGAMSKVYATAERTIIWLGVQSQDSDAAIDFLHELDGKNDLMKNNALEIENMRAPSIMHKWRAMESLLARPWWTRVWTVQELLISERATFYCGTKSFRKSRFSSAMYSMGLCRSHDDPLLRDDVWDPAWHRRRMLQYYRKTGHYQNTRPISIVGAMAFLSDNSVTNPHDRIYALLGMAQSDAAWIGDPDYLSEVEQIYHKFAVDHIRTFESLDIICFAHIFIRTTTAPSSGSKLLPSSAPDWRAKVRPKGVPLMASQYAATHIGNFGPLTRGLSASYAAAGSKKPIKLSLKDHRLTCDGIILDKIDGLGALTDEDGKCLFAEQLIQSSSATNTLKVPDSQDRDLLDSPAVQQLLRTIASALILDRSEKSLISKAPANLLGEIITYCLAACHFQNEVQEQFRTWFQWNQSLLVRGYDLQTIFSSDQLKLSPNNTTFAGTLRNLLLRLPVNDEYLVQLLRGPPNLRRARLGYDNEGFLPCFHNTVFKLKRRLMVTQQGHIGMAPARARKGDVVVVLYGCSIPVLLRPHQDEYEFIGECFVDGYMEGEILEEVEAGTREQKTFVLV